MKRVLEVVLRVEVEDLSAPERRECEKAGGLRRGAIGPEELKELEAREVGGLFAGTHQYDELFAGSCIFAKLVEVDLDRATWLE